MPFFYGWVVVGIAFMAEFLAVGLGGSTLALFFAPMKGDLGWSLTWLVGATTGQAVAAICVAPFAGALIDRFGVKPVMLWGTAVAGGGMITMMLVHEVWQFWVLYAAIGAFGLGELGGLTSSAAVAKWFARKRPRAMAVSTLGQTVGGTLMAPVVAGLIAFAGWRHAWSLMGFTLLIVMLPLITFLMRSKPEDVGLLPDGDASAGPADAAAAATARETWTVREAMRTRTLWLLILAIDLSSFSFGLVSIFPVFLVAQEGMSPVTAGWMISGIMAGSTVSRILWAFIAERVSGRVCLSILCSLRAVSALSLVLVPYPGNVVAFLAFAGLFGGSVGMVQPLVWASYFGRHSFARIQGAIRPFLAIPQLTGAIMLARIFDWKGSFDVGLIAYGCLGLIGASIALLARPPVRPIKGVIAKSIA